MINPQVVLSTSVALLALYKLRTCSLTAFLAAGVAPGVLYALIAERTSATSLRGKVVAVTGASSGLGLAIAKEAARRGARKIYLLARTLTALEKAAAQCREAGAPGALEAVALPCDVTSPGELRAAAAKMGDVEVLVNNAGSGAWKHIEETTPEEAAGMLACPCQAALAITALLVPVMRARGGARRCHVLNVTSAASEGAFRGAVGYSTSRWAMRGFSRNLLWDLKQLGIGVTHLNAFEIVGTEYFSDAPGKAGAASYANMPTLFQLIGRTGISVASTAKAARAGLDGVEKGWSTVNVPGWLLTLVKMLNDIMPCFVEHLNALGPAGVRKASASTS